MTGAVEPSGNGGEVFGDQTPQPQWLMHDDYFLMYSPEDFGSFVNNLECASFAIWDDSENPDLKDWVENFDFEAVSFTEPTGMVFGGEMDFVESPKDFGLEYSVCFFQDGWEEVRCATTRDNLRRFDTVTFAADSIPEVGEVDLGSLLDTPIMAMPGIDNVFG